MPRRTASSSMAVIDARTHELYYYKKQNLKSAEYAGFLKADLKKIAKTR